MTGLINRLTRPILFAMEPEQAHGATIAALACVSDQQAGL